MWSRVELKSRAWDVLRTTYWKAFVVSIVLGIAASQGASFSGSNSGTRSENYNEEALILVLIIGLIIFVVFSIFRIFIGFSLEVGCRKYFILASEGDANFNYMGYAFNGGIYKNILITMFLKGLYTFLWTLLFVIPGIIKSYSYRFVPYILADNPNLEPAEAINLSRDLANENKMAMFFLDCSFIGWYFLGLLACCIGVVFVTPYYNQTLAELYLYLREESISKGEVSPDTYNLVENSVNLEKDF
jgi:uncharacterized membrane protein